MVITTPKFFANVALLTNFPNPQLSTRFEEFLKTKLISFEIIYNGLVCRYLIVEISFWLHANWKKYS